MATKSLCRAAVSGHYLVGLIHINPVLVTSRCSCGALVQAIRVSGSLRHAFVLHRLERHRPQPARAPGRLLAWRPSR